MTELNLKKLVILSDHHAFGDPLFLAANAFIEGALQSHYEILRHNLSELKIKPCANCGSCFTKEVACSYLDDFNTLSSDLLDGDALVVFAQAPFSVTLKNALSKFTVFEAAPNDPHYAKVRLVFVGSESALKKEIQAWLAALLEIAPESASVIRYPSIKEKELSEIKAIGLSF